MSNMEHVRFTNTLTALNDCSAHMDDNDLSDFEQNSRMSLILLCQEIAAGYEVDEFLPKAGETEMKNNQTKAIAKALKELVCINAALLTPIHEARLSAAINILEEVLRVDKKK